MMSSKSNKKQSIKMRLIKDPGNLFISRNKDDNICVPLKLKNPIQNKYFSSKKIKISPFPLLEENKKIQKRYSNSFKILPTYEDSILIPKLQNVETEQSKISNILPKINCNSSNTSTIGNNKIDKKRKSFSYFKDNKSKNKVSIPKKKKVLSKKE